jgi:redox-sensing transcriptional repressor
VVKISIKNQYLRIAMETKKISDLVISRLPLYLRCLGKLNGEGRKITSSQELGEKLAITPAQIRKDLSQFGEFGKQGTGYDIEHLISNIQSILNINKIWDVALIGIGDIGHALANYKGFNQRGFKIAMLFDSDPSKIGEKVGQFTIKDSANLKEDIKNANIKVAMISVPDMVAQDIANELMEAGVKAILNYAPTILTVSQDIRVQYIDPAVHLQIMTYYMD